MRKFLIGIVSEDSKLSSMRLMSIMCVLAAIGTGIYGICANRDLIGTATLVGSFLGPAFAAKCYSKTVETKPTLKSEQ